MPRWQKRELTVRQKALVVKFRPLAYRLAHKWRNRTMGDPDAFESEALHGLIKAALAFDPSRGIKFITYAHRAIDMVLLQLVKGRKGKLPMAPQEDTDEYIGYDLPDTRTPAPGTPVDNAELLPLVRRVLPPRQQDALLSHVVEGQTLQAVGDRMRISKERVRQLNFASCRKLKLHLTGE